MKYEKLDSISHIHHRPDMYVGSIKNQLDNEWIYVNDTIIYRQNLSYNPGLLRIFVEVLSNVIDNVWRSQEKQIPTEKIIINITDDCISVENDGNTIPFTKYKDTDILIPELIFGHLLTSSNYNDQEERLTSGRNGMGIKTCNVFSKRFDIEIYNHELKQLYKQKWENNMRKCYPPSVKDKNTKSLKNNYIIIKFWPDFEKFGLSGFTPDMLDLFYRYCADMSMITHVPVSLNGNRIKIKSLTDYVKLFEAFNTKEFVPLSKSDDLEVILSSSDDGYKEIVFTNGVYNKHGGVHCDAIINEVSKQLLSKIQGKIKSQQISLKDIKRYLMVFVNSRVVNPAFSNQSKDRLMSPTIKFSVDDKHVKSILKWDFVESIRTSANDKEMKTLKKMERKKVRIEGYDPANFAGTKKSQDCTLILCEGLSAKTFAVNGINIGWNGFKGRDYFGILPLRGKILNVRNASIQMIMNNKEVMDICNILNLRHKEQVNMDQLTYGKILILTDADADGIHIASLLLNYFDVLFPDVFKHPFIYLMRTPIAKVKDHTFYSDFEYQQYITSQHNKHLKVKYYKGLGTSSAQEVKETFGQKIIRFHYDDDAQRTLTKVFHQKYAPQRKEWLENFDPKVYTSLEDICDISLFLNQELIRFSIDDCRRNIPNLFDGLKLSQRKILYSIFKRNLLYTSTSMKVAQLAGYVAEVSNYHHGEQCLFDTIIKMTQSFVGSNNIPLLYPDGQFGSRLSLGKDAANGRYIFTKMQPYTHILFSKDDEPLLDYMMDDNDKVEPEYYIPILPLILMNGCNTGIGTGWSCNMPCYNPNDIVDCVYDWIDAKERKKTYMLPELMPGWNDFKGRITKVADSKYMSHGIFEESKGKIIVTEIPINVSTDKYKEFLESLADDKKIKQLKNYSTVDQVHFEFAPNNHFIPDETNLKLTSPIHLTNMVLFGKNHKLQKFMSIGEIFDSFCKERYDLYVKRKRNMIHNLMRSILLLKNKSRFLDMILSQKIKIHHIQDAGITNYLVEHKFDKSDDDDFAYLLNIPIRQMTMTKLQELGHTIKHNEKLLETLEHTSIGDLWRCDLKLFKDTKHKHEK